MEKDFQIIYNKVLDMWILKTGGRQEETKYIHEGTVLFVGGFLPLEEQIDNLLDLILIKGPKQKYFEEVLRRLTSE